MNPKFIIQPEWLFTGEHNGFAKNTAIVCEEGKIKELIPSSSVPEESEYQALQYPGHTLLPGLIDAHVHLTMCGCCSPRQHMMKESDELLLLRASFNARLLIEWGITTARDCGDRNGVTFHLREAIQAGIIPGPHLLLAGPPLTSPRGHCYFMMGEVADREHIEKRIAKAARQGADFIKVMLTGGGLTPGTDSLGLQFAQEDLEFLVTAAKNYGLYVSAHAHSPEAISLAALSGVRTIEHASFVDRKKGVMADPNILKTVKENGSVIVPTNIPAFNAVQMNRQLGLAKEIGISSDEFLNNRMKVTSQLMAKEISLISGSDAGATNVSFRDVKGEIKFMKHVGMDASKALATATGLAATALGLPLTGKISRGYVADLLLAEGNLENDLEVLENVKGVWKNGNRIKNN